MSQGTDFELNAARTALHWSGSPPADLTDITVTYSYWAHTGGIAVEGDFVSRDSFQDTNGDVLYVSCP